MVTRYVTSGSPTKSKKMNLTTATLKWFDDGCCDVKYLDLWQDVPVNYESGQATDERWCSDHHETVIATDASGKLFRYAVDLLMTYQFYPPDLMSCTSDFSLEQRWLRVGDRIVQRIHLFYLFGRPVIDAVGMTEVSAVVMKPDRYGFTYVTVATHAAEGKWSTQVARQANGDVVLTLDAISRPVPEEPARNHAFIRSFQRTAHQRGISHFKQAVNAVALA